MIKMSVSVSYILLTKTNLLKYNFIYHTFVFLFLTQTIQNSTQSLIDITAKDMRFRLIQHNLRGKLEILSFNNASSTVECVVKYVC